MKRVHDGDIGELVAGQCYWNMGALWLDRAAQNWANRTAKGWSDMEWQIRNWLFTAGPPATTSSSSTSTTSTS